MTLSYNTVKQKLLSEKTKPSATKLSKPNSIRCKRNTNKPKLR